jgi:3-deoxy-manno-octulosonate cytidylyltransferase (CMP-KDO synthetase)
MVRTIGVIPARYGSTRLNGKPLIPLAGKPLVQWVYEAACRASRLNNVLIATDDERIVTAVRSFGAQCVITSPSLPSGTDRVAAAIVDQPADIVANLQGDEPLMDPMNIDRCIEALIADSEAHISSAMIRISNEEDFQSPAAVKVVTDAVGRAMYFSRAPIPDHSRLSEQDRSQAAHPMKHLGLYVYRRDVLENVVQLPVSRYEFTEKLEQLRFIEAGYRIRMVEVWEDSIGVDTKEDAERVDRILRTR